MARCAQLSSSWLRLLAGRCCCFAGGRRRPRSRLRRSRSRSSRASSSFSSPATGSGVDGVAAALLKGPTAAERTKDTRTAIPDGTPLRSVAQQGNVVTVDLGEKFALGTNADSLNARLVQVVLSFTTVPGVKYVRLLIKGGVPLGLFPGFPTSRPLTAKDVQRRPSRRRARPAPGSTGPDARGDKGAAAAARRPQLPRPGRCRRQGRRADEGGRDGVPEVAATRPRRRRRARRR